ncbi:hypothetical protein EOD39_16853 [Acipenser ruthenus]|uniref:Uncharacterized protein n=1 Tax=Acipenser ruthenus TaxID=7906 RepID=A0A444V4V0_ACIRT|nr:hypothetical protein EOD39_16853 [Acipenser ruthenus]
MLTTAMSVKENQKLHALGSSEGYSKQGQATGNAVNPFKTLQVLSKFQYCTISDDKVQYAFYKLDGIPCAKPKNLDMAS